MGWLKQYFSSLAPNFGTLVPERLYRSAQPSINDLKRYIEEYDIEVVLNLRDGDRSKERAAAESLGLRFEHVEMSDKAAPTDEQIKKALAVLRSGRVVLFGCRGNRHRGAVVGAVYAAVDLNQSKAEAWREQAIAFGYYSALGHGAIEEWFFATDLEKFK